jgi:EAL domain-containing protein (putative c-di-GMP-specific phosphodiesterase class I)
VGAATWVERIYNRDDDELQGFYFRRPLPVDEFTQLPREQATAITYIVKRLGSKT